MPEITTTTVSGVAARGYRRGPNAGDPWDQQVILAPDRIISFKGRAATFITPGRAAVGQKILALHNATGSAVLVNVNRVRVDLLTTVAKLNTVIPPIIRVHRFTVVPTNGTVLGKVGLDSSQSSNASVTAWGDASADGTGSGTTLTVTIPSSSTLAQVYAPRITTVVVPTTTTALSPTYEPIDTAEFFIGETDITLRALEGICVFLDQAVVTTGNPSTDRWIAMIDWDEYTRP